MICFDWKGCYLKYYWNLKISFKLFIIICEKKLSNWWDIILMRNKKKKYENNKGNGRY